MFAELLASRMRGMCQLSDLQVAQLQFHFELLLRWNERLNLTSVQGTPEIVERHYCESIFLGAHLPKGFLSIADVGSGAGFPGIPVAVLRPDCQVSLIESHQRKAVFLRESSRGVKNVRVLAVRAENAGERFDWAISRAVKYAEIRKALKQLAPNVALLTGEVRPSEMTGFDWHPPILLPWGKHRYLWLGSDVSRET